MAQHDLEWYVALLVVCLKIACDIHFSYTYLNTRLFYLHYIFKMNITTELGSKYLPKKNRYSLYVSRACPSSHNVLLVHSLKGLQDTVSVIYVHARPGENQMQRQWVIAQGIPDDSMASLKSEAGNITSMAEMYQKELDENNNSTTCNAIPLLYDKHNDCIVNNNVTDIVKMLNGCFNDSEMSENPTLDLLSGACNDTLAQTKLEEVKTWLYPLLQLVPSALPPYHYCLSNRELEYAFVRATNILQRQRYLTSHTAITEMDLRLFVTLIRYEEVYSKYLGGSSPPPQLLHNPALLDFCRDVYQQPGVTDTVNMEEIRTHFLGRKHTSGAKSCLEALLQMPHKRNLL